MLKYKCSLPQKGSEEGKFLTGDRKVKKQMELVESFA